MSSRDPASMEHTLAKAAQLYDGLATGEYKLFQQRGYRFYDVDRAVMRDHAARLRMAAAIVSQLSSHELSKTETDVENKSPFSSSESSTSEGRRT